MQVGEVISGRARMEWVVAVKRRRLMESPHHETGSQDEVSILATEAKVSAREVTRAVTNTAAGARWRWRT